MLRGEPAPFFVWSYQKGAEVSKIGTPPAAGCHKRRLPDDAIMTSLPSPSDLFLAAPVARRSQRAAAKEANILISNLISFPDREDDESEHGNRADRDIANVAVMLQQPTITRHLIRHPTCLGGFRQELRSFGTGTVSKPHETSTPLFFCAHISMSGGMTASPKLSWKLLSIL